MFGAVLYRTMVPYTLVLCVLTHKWTKPQADLCLKRDNRCIHPHRTQQYIPTYPTAVHSYVFRHWGTLLLALYQSLHQIFSCDPNRLGSNFPSGMKPDPDPTGGHDRPMAISRLTLAQIRRVVGYPAKGCPLDFCRFYGCRQDWSSSEEDLEMADGRRIILTSWTSGQGRLQDWQLPAT